jgi:hypothetical protein
MERTEEMEESKKDVKREDNMEEKDV